MGQILIAIVIREVTFDLKIFIAFRILLIDLISPLICKLQPGPRDAPLKCFIRRNRATQSYFLCIGVTDALADDGKFLLAARKYRRPSCTEYLISLDARDTSKGNGTYIGKLRSNFLGTKFTVYDAHPPCAGAVASKGPSAHVIGSAQVSPMKPLPAGNYPVSHISYEVNVLGSRYGKTL